MVRAWNLRLPRLAKPRGVVFQTDAGVVLFLVIGVLLFHWRIVFGLSHFPYDIEEYHFPELAFNFRELCHGRIPLYDPWIYSGTPYVINSQAALWYPIHIIYFFVLRPFTSELTLYQVQFLNLGHFALGAVGMFFWMRHWKISRVWAATGALLFVFNGHVLAQAQHLGVIEINGWLPWIGLQADRFSENPTAWRGAALGALGAFPVLIGFLPQAAACLIVFGFYTVFQVFLRGPIVWKKILLGALSGGTVLLLLSAPVILPLFEMLPRGPAIPLGFHGSVNPAVLKMLIVPTIFRPFRLNAYNGPDDPTADYFYAGALTPLLLLWGGWTESRRMPVHLLLFVGSALIAFARPLSSLLQWLPTVGELIRPGNFTIFIVLFGILIAARAGESFPYPGTFICLGGLTSLAGLLFERNDSGPEWIWRVAFISILTVATIGCSAWRGNLRAATLSIFICLELATIHIDRLFWSAPGVPNSITSDSIDFDHRELFAFLKSSSDPGRVAVNQQKMGGPWNAGWRVWQIESINGFEPTLSRVYRDELDKSIITWRTNRIFNPGRLDSPMFELLNVRWLVTPEKLSNPKWKLVFTNYFRVYEDLQFHERYAVVPPGVWQQSAGFPPEASYRPQKIRSGRVQIRQRLPGVVKLVVRVDTPGSLLFCSEMYHPDWKVWIDNKPDTLWKIDRICSGIPLATGLHRVTLQFSPSGKWPAMFAYAAGLLILASLGLVVRAR